MEVSENISLELVLVVSINMEAARTLRYDPRKATWTLSTQALYGNQEAVLFYLPLPDEGEVEIYCQCGLVQ